MTQPNTEITDEDAAEVFRRIAAMSGGPSEGAQVDFGLNPDGTVAESGLTAEGRRFAARKADEINAQYGALMLAHRQEALREAENLLWAIHNEAQRESALRIYAQANGGFDEVDQKLFGVTADGRVADGGLTEAGYLFALDTRRVVEESIKEIAGEQEGEATGRQAPGKRPPTEAETRAMTRASIDAMGLRGPFRAAIRAFAQSLAASLNDGEADDEGFTGARHEAAGEGGDDVHTVTLGREPFVLLRVVPHTLPNGDQVGAMSVAAGGGITHGSEENGAMTVESVLALALNGVRQAEPSVSVRADSPDQLQDLTRNMSERIRRLAEAEINSMGDAHDPGEVRPGESGFVPAPESGFVPAPDRGDHLGNSGPGWAASAGAPANGFGHSSTPVKPQCDDGVGTAPPSPVGGVGFSAAEGSASSGSSPDSGGGTAGGE